MSSYFRMNLETIERQHNLDRAINRGLEFVGIRDRG